MKGTAGAVLIAVCLAVLSHDGGTRRFRTFRSLQDERYFEVLCRAIKERQALADVSRALRMAGACSPEACRRRTPLYWAVSYGRADIVELLICRGADVNGRSGGYGTPLRAAVASKRVDMIELLLSKGANVKRDEEYGESSLYCATVDGTTEAARVLIDNGADVNWRRWDDKALLHTAVEWYRTKIARLLIVGGADINVEAYGLTPLDYADGEEMKALLRAYGAKTWEEIHAEPGKGAQK